MRARPRRYLAGAILLAAISLLVACGGNVGDVDPRQALLAIAPPPSWQPTGEVLQYNRETLFDLVDGQAEAYFAYAFQEVAVQRYERTTGASDPLAIVDIELWQLATPADAYGLYTAGIAGEPIAIGNDGDHDPGRRVAFWQDRYYVRVRARQAIPDDDVQTFAHQAAEALPTGGERPPLAQSLPTEGLIPRSRLFFHEEISIQDRLWLGGENLLGLGPQSDGVLARYDLADGPAQLLLVRYPNPADATAALEALYSSEIETFVTGDADGDLLGAVFGQIDEPAALKLLAGALEAK